MLKWMELREISRQRMAERCQREVNVREVDRDIEAWLRPKSGSALPIHFVSDIRIAAALKRR